ncbi:hypothetical protein [Haladaptatus caseinilyticus]|uniref:hypothetical protein n=1 Tax=Haladaptatus caseinilyticus TaxID=2993314 RepID=UPI00224AFAE9|nr:hypothetical protein [Haladaptatus caseinilyticus]
MTTEEAVSPSETATSVVVSYPEDLSSWGQFQLDQRPFRAYLLKTKAEVREGDVWEEFLDVGCCGDTLDVPLRVESVEGGDRMGPETEIVYEAREACGIRGGWLVQSADGPNEF